MSSQMTRFLVLSFFSWKINSTYHTWLYIIGVFKIWNLHCLIKAISVLFKTYKTATIKETGAGETLNGNKATNIFRVKTRNYLKTTDTYLLWKSREVKRGQSPFFVSFCKFGLGRKRSTKVTLDIMQISLTLKQTNSLF